MGISDYMAGLREHVGQALILMPCASGVVRDDAGRVLIQRRSDNGEWCLPGGAIDPDEQPAQACVREVYEETGLVVRPIRVLSVETHPRYAYPHGDRIQAVVTVFECAVVGGSLGSLDGESVELAFVDPAQLPESFMLDTSLPGVIDGSLRHSVFAWDDAWLPSSPLTARDPTV